MDKLVFSLERIAFYNQCKFVAIAKDDLGDNGDIASDLDYIKKKSDSAKWFIKYNEWNIYKTWKYTERMLIADHIYQRTMNTNIMLGVKDWR